MACMYSVCVLQQCVLYATSCSHRFRLSHAGERWRPSLPGAHRAARAARRDPAGGAGRVPRRQEDGRRGVQPPLPAAAGGGGGRAVRAVHQAQRLQEHLPRRAHSRHALRGHLHHVRGGRRHGLRGRGRDRQCVQHGAGHGAHHPLHLGVHPLLGRVPRAGRRHRPGGWGALGPGEVEVRSTNAHEWIPSLDV